MTIWPSCARRTRGLRSELMCMPTALSPNVESWTRGQGTSPAARSRGARTARNASRQSAIPRPLGLVSPFAYLRRPSRARLGLPQRTQASKALQTPSRERPRHSIIPRWNRPCILGESPLARLGHARGPRGRGGCAPLPPLGGQKARMRNSGGGGETPAEEAKLRRRRRNSGGGGETPAEGRNSG